MDSCLKADLKLRLCAGGKREFSHHDTVIPVILVHLFLSLEWSPCSLELETPTFKAGGNIMMRLFSLPATQDNDHNKLSHSNTIDGDKS